MSAYPSNLVFDRTIAPTIGHISLAGMHTSRGLPAQPLRVLGQYALVYITRGRGRFADAHGATHSVSAGDLLHIFPDIGHTYAPVDGESWDEIFLVFGGQVFDVWREGGLLDPLRPVWRLEPVDYWAQRLLDVAWTNAAMDRGDALDRVCRLQQFLAATRRNEPPDQVGSESAWLLRAKALLSSTGTGPPDYNELARRLDMSYDGFRKRFTREAGMTPAQYHSHMRINQACDYLVSSDATLREIALRLGFSDEYHFSKRFKQLVGMPPRHFRNFFDRQHASPR